MSSTNASPRVTNIGAMKNGEQLVLGRCYMLKHFMLGSGGHDPATNLAVVPDQTLVELPSPKFGEIQPIPAGSAYVVGPRQTQYKIRLPAGVATGALSSIGLYGEIVNVVDPNDAALIGTTFLHSVMNFNLQNKDANEAKTITLTLNNV